MSLKPKTQKRDRINMMLDLLLTCRTLEKTERNYVTNIAGYAFITTSSAKVMIENLIKEGSLERVNKRIFVTDKGLDTIYELRKLISRNKLYTDKLGTYIRERKR